MQNDRNYSRGHVSISGDRIPQHSNCTFDAQIEVKISTVADSMIGLIAMNPSTDSLENALNAMLVIINTKIIQ